MLTTFALAENPTHDPSFSNPTLYRVAIKADLYSKTMQVWDIPNTSTYPHPILDSSPNLSLSFHEPIQDMDALRAHRLVISFGVRAPETVQ